MLDVVGVFVKSELATCVLWFCWMLWTILDAVTCLKCKIVSGVCVESVLCEDNCVESELFKVFVLKVHDNHLSTCKKRQ